MRALLLTARADASARASGADAIVAEAAAPGGPPFYALLPPLDAAGALDVLSSAADQAPRGFALPLAAGGADVQRLGARLAVEEARLGLEEGAFRILAFATQSPRAIFGLSSYAAASARLEALVFTVAPLDAALGVTRRSAGPLRLARDLTLIAARAAGVLALDAPYPDVDNLDGLRAEALAAAADGFDGKAALNATQVQVILEAFARTAASQVRAAVSAPNSAS